MEYIRKGCIYPSLFSIYRCNRTLKICTIKKKWIPFLQKCEDIHFVELLNIFMRTLLSMVFSALCFLLDLSFNLFWLEQ